MLRLIRETRMIRNTNGTGASCGAWVARPELKKILHNRHQPAILENPFTGFFIKVLTKAPALILACALRENGFTKGALWKKRLIVFGNGGYTDRYA